jgi:putative Holliday junction resolvase
MRVLGLDIGEKRIGVAVSDPAGAVATPLVVLDAKRVLGDGLDLRRIIAEYEVDEVVIGLPLSLDGTEGPQARRVRAIAGRLGAYVDVPLSFADERYSSSDAKRSMSATGVSERAQRGSVDMVAAAIFLQCHLDSRRTSQSGESGR